jgi:hypothetical protein
MSATKSLKSPKSNERAGGSRQSTGDFNKPVLFRAKPPEVHGF